MPTLKIYSVSLGCPKTRVDSERLLGALGKVCPVDKPEDAQLIFINTCGFIRPAVEESLQAVLDAASAAGEADARNRPLLAVAGCLVSRYAGELSPEMPEVDLWLPLDAMDHWPSMVSEALQRRGLAQGPELAAWPARFGGPVSYAYLKVSEGCSHACSFCTIPSIRGKLRSEPADRLLVEARMLLDRGVSELVLVAQDLTAYGREAEGSDGLIRLLEQLLPLSGLARLRLMYLYPAGLTDELLSFLRTAGAPLLPYFDIPLQHAHPEILSRMGRPFARDPWRVLDRVRERFPEAAIRTSLIAGFPGETQEHFQALLDFVRKARLTHLGVFPYWPEEGTAAAGMEGQVDEDIKQERVRLLMEAQEEISEELMAGYVGQELDVLVDEPSPDWPGLHIGRAWFQAPEVDGVVYVSGPGVAPGRTVKAMVEEAGAYDLSALA
ncbi:30S ribosomal protein S12 methylthiotransferase RimO [Desulfocurvibacter africanus]|uniref:30S ribosomal protein S12 methylthiotransferase RimO n=1 Tax=Desulfocurvibacter africanus TaxID=873 RepID=UPI0004839DDE|nr:30S ribosomal protein S12 methylthiotransferase RimO [Desulfocurvibacter africanus]